MIQVNLLPWREKRRKKILLIFYRNIGVSVGLALLVLVMLHQHYKSILNKQIHRSEVINIEITAESKIVDQLKGKIKLSKENYNKLSFIIGIKKQSFLSVRVLNEMIKVVPEGVDILNLRYEGKKVFLVGEAASNTMITQLMKNIKASEFFSNPTLSGFSVSSQVAGAERTFQITFALLDRG